MNEYTERIGQYLSEVDAPQDVRKALVELNKRLESYAIDKDDAEKALAWKGIGLADDDSVASGIERLYGKLSMQRTNATKLVNAVERWQAEVPTREQRESGLAKQVLQLHTLYQEAMTEWANVDFLSDASDALDNQMDVLREEVMELLPLIVKTLKHQS